MKRRGRPDRSAEGTKGRLGQRRAMPERLCGVPPGGSPRKCRSRTRVPEAAQAVRDYYGESAKLCCAGLWSIQLTTQGRRACGARAS